jgi:hypothetical protein
MPLNIGIGEILVVVIFFSIGYVIVRIYRKIK